MSPAPAVLITGAGGFIGRHCLAPLRDAGFDLHGVVRPGSERGLPDAEGVSWHAVDLLEPTETRELLRSLRPPWLLHVGWFARHGTLWTDLENLRWVEATLQLFREFADAGGRRAVAVGTCAEYGPHDLCHERDTPMHPVGLYGTAKYATQQCLDAAAGALGVSLAWARLFFPFGPHDQPQRLIPYLIEQLLDGEQADCSPGTQVRDLMFVDEVGAALAAVLASAVTGPVNVASGSGVPLARVMTEIADLLGRPDLLKLGALPLREDEPARWVAAVDRLRDEVGHRPALSLRTGLQRTIAWHRRRRSATRLPGARRTLE